MTGATNAENAYTDGRVRPTVMRPAYPAMDDRGGWYAWVENKSTVALVDAAIHIRTYLYYGSDHEDRSDLEEAANRLGYVLGAIKTHLGATDA